MIASIAPHRVFATHVAGPVVENTRMDYGPSPALSLRPPTPERISPQLKAQLLWEQNQINRGFGGRRRIR